MPKKVITRRQRKAAEAKRQSDSQSVNGVAECSGNATATVTQSADKQAAGRKATKAALFQQPPKDRAGQAKNVIAAEDKKAPSDKSSLDLIEDENEEEDVDYDTEDDMQTSQPASDGQGAFSKSLTRRAVAAFTKMQKLSKGFNKKRTYKNQAPTVPPDAIDLSDPQFDETVKTALSGPLASEILSSNSCSCEFCTTVLNQLLSSKKRVEKKVCKKGIKRTLSSHMGTASGRINKANDLKSLELPMEAKFKESDKIKITPSKRRIIQKLEKKEKRLEKQVMRKIKQLEKQKKIEVTGQFIKNSLAKLQKNRKGIDHGAKAECSKQACSSSAKLDSTTISKANVAQNLGRKANDPAPITETFNKSPRQTTKLAQLVSAVEKLAVDQPETAKPKVIGNTGYFILVGNDAQLSEQIDKLAAQNVVVEDCVVLEPDVADKVEQQLEQIQMNRDQILQRMRNKHMTTKTRRRRLKDV